MKKSILRQVLLPVLLASFCSGAVNADGQMTMTQDKFQNGALNGTLSDSTNKGNSADKAKNGFSGLSMVGTNALSLTGGFLGGYLAGKLNAPKGPGTPNGPTQEEYDAVVAEKFKLQNEVEALKNSNPSTAKIYELEDKIQQLTSDLEKAKPYMDTANTIFDKYNVAENKRIITLENSLSAAMAVWKRDDAVCDCNFTKISNALDKIKHGGVGYGQYVRFILDHSLADKAYWQAVIAGNFQLFNDGESKGAAPLARQLEEIVSSQHQIMKSFDNLDQE